MDEFVFWSGALAVAYWNLLLWPSPVLEPIACPPPFFDRREAVGVRVWERWPPGDCNSLSGFLHFDAADGQHAENTKCESARSTWVGSVSELQKKELQHAHAGSMVVLVCSS